MILLLAIVNLATSVFLAFQGDAFCFFNYFIFALMLRFHYA